MVGVKATAWVAMSPTAARIACSRVSLSAASPAGIEVSASTTYAPAGLAVARRTRPRATAIERARIFAMSSSPTADHGTVMTNSDVIPVAALPSFRKNETAERDHRCRGDGVLDLGPMHP